jgi:hypothetical protein
VLPRSPGAAASNKRGRPPDASLQARRGGTVSTQPSALRNALISLPKTHCCFLTSAARSELSRWLALLPTQRRTSRTAARRFLTWCLPASLIIRSPLWTSGTRRPAGTQGPNSLDRLDATLKVRHEMALGKKTAPVQYLRAIRPSLPAEGTRTSEPGFVNCAPVMFRHGLSQSVLEGRRGGVPT